MNFLQGFGNMPAPMKGLVLLGTGAGITSVFMSFWDPTNPFWRWLAFGIILIVAILGLFKLLLYLRDKGKAGPFAKLLSRGGARAGADPAAKARMDDLRKKFDEGVTTFKAAGKDLYSLPWYLLVGPSGSGKTEALRHCNVGFPPGLQDCLQGSGGTLNMHWWFTNHAVVLDTAGRMFMEEGENSEWKEFLKLLKVARPNCPVNGLLLVISSESLLKDSAEKIEATAGAIARQLDVIQRTLDVRFPVFVVVTKCDKIIGFREFFETINDPGLQHQILGWSNPAPLDEVFKPEFVDKHLEVVRQKLLKRRMGLMQNPVHTQDPNQRRTDQVDEMFELPDNLVRIAPRLRRYLEMIFVAGEWSPKPLFLRGIFFTSSMREGQALDVSLAQALSIDVEAIPGGREWDKEKAYFLRDVFMGKVFKEKGLVTRATNIGKQMAKQRRVMVFGSMAATVILVGITVLGWWQFKQSLGPPSTFWSKVHGAYAGDEALRLERQDLRLVDAAEDAGKVTYAYRGATRFADVGALGDDMSTPAEVVAETGRRSAEPISAPTIAKPISLFLGFSDGFTSQQVDAHRALLESTTVVPLLQATRSKLQAEDQWGPDAVAALAQLVRLQTYSFGGTPSEGATSLLADLKSGKLPGKEAPKPAIDIDVLFKYVLGPKAYGDRAGYAGDREKLQRALQAAYPGGFGKGSPPNEVLGGKDPGNVKLVEGAVGDLVAHLLKLGATKDSDMEKLQHLHAGLSVFREEEKRLQNVQFLRGTPPAGGAAGAGVASPKTVKEYDDFDGQVKEPVVRSTIKASSALYTTRVLFTITG